MASGTVLVNLKRDWFGPDQSLHQVRDNPHKFPDDWEDQLPSTAEKLSAKEAKAVEK